MSLKVDVSVNPLIDELRSAQSVVEDLSREVASKVGSVELDPVRLREVDDRISSLVRLKKKYGPTLDEVLATRERLTEELETLDQSETDWQRFEVRGDAPREGSA